MRGRAAAPVLALLIFVVAGCGLLPPRQGQVETAAWPLACSEVPGIAGGPEDAVVGDDGIAFVSSTDRRRALGHEETSRETPIGWIYRIDLNEASPRGVDATPPQIAADVFQPHGMSLLTLADGGRLLFVINHRPAWLEPTWYRRNGRWDQCEGTDTVEIFRVGRGGELSHEETIRAERAGLISPNDIAAVGPRQFYVTNDHGVGSCAGRLLRDVLGWNDGNLTYFDGRAQVVAALSWANGVAVSDRGAGRRRVYASSGSAGTIVELAWDEEHPARPTGRDPVRLGSLADNIEVDPDGSLLIAAHPSMARFIANGFGWFGTRKSPSQVVAVRWPDGGAAAAREIWSDDGERFPASSVAVPYPASHRRASRLLVGTVFGPLALCERGAPR